MADVSTRVGVRFSHCVRHAAWGSGKTQLLQWFIISLFPLGVVDISGGGGGADNGDTIVAGRTSCNVGGTAAARINVSCSCETNSATSAMPRAAAV